jgi:hypothetical protein
MSCTPRAIVEALHNKVEADAHHRTTTAVLPSPSPSDEPSPSLSHNEVPQRNDENQHPAADLNQFFDIVGWGSPMHTTPQTIQTPPSMEVESGPSHLQAIPSQTPRDHWSAPSQDFEFSSTTNAPDPRGLQSQHDQRPPTQEIQSSIHTQPHTESQRPASVNASLQSTMSPLHIEAPIPRQESRGQRPSPIRINSSSPESLFGNAAFSPIVIPDQSPLQSGVERVPLPSSLLPSQAPPPPSRETNIPLNTHQHQRTHPPMMPPLKPMVSTIKAHIAKVGGSQNLNNNLERPRFELLMEACDNQDIFYVVVHQIFCVWDHDKSQLISSFFPTTDVLSAAFTILGQLIRDNQGMAPNHLRWFSAFPGPLDSLLATSEPYRRVLGDVVIFLRKLASQWDIFSRQCHSRHYPPLVHELANHLGILSPILHRVTFTATRRNLGIGDDPAIEEIFSEDKRGYQEHSERYKASRPPGQSEIIQRNNDLATRYYALALRQAQRRAQLRGSGQLVGSSLFRPPMVPNVVPSQAGSSLSRPPMAPNDVSSRPSISGLESTHFRNVNPQNPGPRGNQQTQSMRITTTGSSNPSLVAGTGRSPSMTSRPSYAEAPSPTFFQNIFIHSPVTGSPTMPSTMPPSISPSPVQQGSQWSSPVIGNNDISSQQSPNPPVYSSQGQDRAAMSNPSPAVDQVNYMRAQAAQNMFAIQQQQVLNFQAQNLQPHAAAVQAQQQQIPQQVPQQMLQPPQQREPQPRAASMHRAAQLRSNAIPQSWSQPQNSSSPHGLATSGVATPGPQSHGPLSRRSATSVEIMQHLTQPHSNPPAALVQPLISLVGYVHPPQAVDPEITALHQAHVRSPRLVAGEITQDDKTPEGDISRRFYQFVKGFALEPSKIPPTASISKFVFTVSDQDLPLIAKDKWPTTDPLATREFKQGTLQYRLRCTRSKQDIEQDAARRLTAEWSISDTTWPEMAFIQINGEDLDIRRKTHHGKDLPIDITRHILPGSPWHSSINHVKISTPRSRRSKDEGVYFLAVEVVEILQHSQIMDMCHQHPRLGNPKLHQEIPRGAHGR